MPPPRAGMPVPVICLKVYGGTTLWTTVTVSNNREATKYRASIAICEDVLRDCWIGTIYLLAVSVHMLPDQLIPPRIRCSASGICKLIFSLKNIRNLVDIRIRRTNRREGLHTHQSLQKQWRIFSYATSGGYAIDIYLPIRLEQQILRTVPTKNEFTEYFWRKPLIRQFVI